MSSETGNPLLRLCDVPVGEAATIVELAFPISAQDYLMRLGFVPGAGVEVVRKLPFRGPVIYRTQGADTAIRHDIAERIHVRMSVAAETEEP